jgi:hypothetical protein
MTSCDFDRETPHGERSASESDTKQDRVADQQSGNTSDNPTNCGSDKRSDGQCRHNLSLQFTTHPGDSNNSHYQHESPQRGKEFQGHSEKDQQNGDESGHAENLPDGDLSSSGDMESDGLGEREAGCAAL